MEKKEILLPSKKFFKANEEDINLNVNLENEQSLLREGDMNSTINLQELFDKERNKSIQYKIYGYKGKQVRDNIHSEDVASLMFEFYQRPRAGEVYNLGGGKGN